MAELDHLELNNIAGLHPHTKVPTYELKKRMLDLVFCCLLILLTFPIALVISAYIKLVSDGPAIFRQVRIGRKGVPFIAHKFRSMHEDAEGSLDTIFDDDERIIPGGRFLRATHLDELPQLWNVLRGEMSLVGPRPRPPEVDHEWICVDHMYLNRRLVRPGITGPAQLSGRSVSREEKREAILLEHDYVHNWSPWRDIAILAMTVPEVLSRKGV